MTIQSNIVTELMELRKNKTLSDYYFSALEMNIVFEIYGIQNQERSLTEQEFTSQKTGNEQIKTLQLFLSISAESLFLN
jgi:hypothetical protein